MYLISLLVFFGSTMLDAQSHKPKLSDFKKNVYSQFGEDGIVEKIFQTIGTTSKIVVEFGANDGFSCSNTANLWKNGQGWEGILIEAEKTLFQQLCVNVISYNCVPIHRRVGFESHDCLEKILEEYAVEDAIDLLSIDIDGADYHILRSLKKIRPRIIICEYNPTMPAHLDLYSSATNNIGCSVAALQRVATELGYSLIALTECNCFFVVNEEFHKFNMFDTDREHMRIDHYVAYLISDYKNGYKLITAPEFFIPWGWHERQSSEELHGKFKTISGVVIK